MEILYVSHCVPWPPDKGERIRAFHSVRALVERHRVHVVCLARSNAEKRAECELRERCASVAIELLDKPRAIARGLTCFAQGGCFTAGFYASPELQAHADNIIARKRIGAVVLLSSGMASYAPETIPFIADWGDVDSEKRFQYGRTRLSGPIQMAEAKRLRRVEREVAMRARRTFLTTANELDLFRRIAPEASAARAGNGVDFAWFNPDARLDVPDELRRRKFLVFVGMLSYFPNGDGITYFAEAIFPVLRRRDPELELFVVGRDPPREVRRLGRLDGITVTGEVADVRPYLAASRGVVVPLRIARGIQNKVLEALAMGKTVLASREVCRTFLPELPRGIIACGSADDYTAAAVGLPGQAGSDARIVAATRARFDWPASLAPLLQELDAIERAG